MFDRCRMKMSRFCNGITRKMGEWSDLVERFLDSFLRNATCSDGLLFEVLKKFCTSSPIMVPEPPQLLYIDKN